MRVCMTVAGHGVPVDSSVNFVHFVFSYPISDFLASYVQTPFDGGFGEGILLRKRSDRQIVYIVVHEEVSVLGR